MPSSDLAATPNRSSPSPADQPLRLPDETNWVHKPMTRAVLATVLIVILFVWTFHFGLFRFWQRVNPFTGDPDWGHALFIPMVGLFYLHANRDRLQRCRVEFFWPAWLIVLAGLAAYAYGLWTWTYFVEPGDFIQGLAIITVIAGIVLLLYGRQVMRVAMFPIAYLLLANPWPAVFEDRLTLPLQHISASASVAILQMAGLSAEQSGNRVQIFSAIGPPRMFNVAEACSGLRSVITFLAVATAIGFIPRRPLARKIAVVAAALPISVAANAIRIALQGIIDHYVTQAVSSGTPHEIFGLIMMIPGLMALLGVAWAIDKFFHLTHTPEPNNQRGDKRGRESLMGPTASDTPDPFNVSTPATAAQGNRQSLRIWPYWSVVAVLALAGVAVQAAPVAIEAALGKQPVPLRQPLSSLAGKLGPWRQVSADTQLDPDVEVVLGANNYLIRSYYDTHRLPAGALADFASADATTRGRIAAQWVADDPAGCINVGIYYYTGRIDKVGHIPENCYVASGFNPVGDPVESAWTIDHKPLAYRFDHFESRRDPLPPLGCCVAYFFQVNGTYVDDRLAVRSAMANVLQTHAYFAKIEVMSPVRDPDDAKRVMGDFVASAIGPIEQILPGTPIYSSSAAPVSDSSVARSSSSPSPRSQP